MNKKYNSIQVLRGLAAWIVVLHHYIQFIYIHNDQPTWDIGVFLYKYGPFGVDIFFVLSGFVMYNTARNINTTATSFLFNRIFRIFPVYWFYTILLVIFLWILPAYCIKTEYTTITLIASFLLIPTLNPNGRGYIPVLYVGWTLFFEMFFYLMLSFSLYINKKYAVLICAIILGILPLVLGDFELLGRSNFRFYEFLAGLGICYAFTHFNNLFEKFKYAIALLFTVIAIVLPLKLGWTANSQFGIAVSILIIFLSIENWFRNEQKWNLFLIHLGDISYSTYLSHPVIIGICYFIFGHNLNLLSGTIAMSVYILIVYGISYLTYKYIEVGSVVTRMRNNTIKSVTKAGYSFMSFAGIRNFKK